MKLHDFTAVIQKVSPVKTTISEKKFCFIIVRKAAKNGREDLFNIYVPERMIGKVRLAQVGQTVRVSTFLNGHEDLENDKFKYTMKMRLNDIENIKFL